MGTAVAEVEVGAIREFLDLLPSSHRILTSQTAPYDGVVRFVVESPLIKGNFNQLTLIAERSDSVHDFVTKVSVTVEPL